MKRAFVIKREAYPENFRGFNKYGYTSWTSYQPDGLRVPAAEIAQTMERIQATAHSNAVKLSAHLLATTKLTDSALQPVISNLQTDLLPPSAPPGSLQRVVSGRSDFQPAFLTGDSTEEREPTDY